MNYQKIYEDLISKAKSENRKKYKGVYYEKHHIIPRCLEGKDDKENKVLLTAKEHFICHKLLIRIYPDTAKLINALWMMSNVRLGNRRNYRIGSREYEKLRQVYSKDTSIRVKGKNNGMYGKKMSEYTKERLKEANLGRKASVESRLKMSESRKGIKKSEEWKRKLSFSKIGEKNPFFGKHLSEEHKLKMSKSLIGNIKFSDEECKRRSERQRGKKYSIELKKKLSDIQKVLLSDPTRKEKHSKAMKSLSVLKCPHCGLESRSHGNLKRWHFDNCKNKLITKV